MVAALSSPIAISLKVTQEFIDFNWKTLKAPTILTEMVEIFTSFFYHSTMRGCFTNKSHKETRSFWIPGKREGNIDTSFVIEGNDT